MSVQSYTNDDVSYTQAVAERPTDRGKTTPSLPLSPSKDETRRREPPQRQGRATPLHTSTPSPRARRRDWPAPRYTRSSIERGEPALVHTPKANNTHNKQPPKKKHSTRKKHAKTHQGPGPAPPRRPLHIIQVERPRQQSRATRARSRRRVSTATHSVRPSKT